MEVYTRLDRIRKIRDMEVVTITVDNDLEDVVEIFSRLNSRGTRVTEADIYLGVVAARTPGWVRENFLPFVSQLSELGYEISPIIGLWGLKAPTRWERCVLMEAKGTRSSAVGPTILRFWLRAASIGLEMYCMAAQSGESSLLTARESG